MAIQLFTGGATLSSVSGRFAVNARTACTLMAWIRANDATAWAARVSMTGVYGPATPTTAIQLGCISANNLGCWTWGGNTLVQATGYTPPVGSWNHYAITYVGGTTAAFSLYINGVLNNTTTSTQLAGTLGQTFINGYPTGGTNETGNFSVDDFIFFNRQLTADEIKTIYYLEGPRDGIVQGVQARYTFEEGTVGANVVKSVDIGNNKADMTPSTGTANVYYTPRATSNLRRPQ